MYSVPPRLGASPRGLEGDLGRQGLSRDATASGGKLVYNPDERMGADDKISR